MKVTQLDHLVLTVSDIKKTIDFYEKVLGMTQVSFGDERSALVFGNQKINLHQVGNELEPKAAHVKAGSADLCFLVNTSINDAYGHLLESGVEIIDGPVSRTGATGNMTSLYFRDPDQNLIEVSNYDLTE